VTKSINDPEVRPGGRKRHPLKRGLGQDLLGGGNPRKRNTKQMEEIGPKAHSQNRGWFGKKGDHGVKVPPYFGDEESGTKLIQKRGNVRRTEGVKEGMGKKKRSIALAKIREEEVNAEKNMVGKGGG